MDANIRNLERQALSDPSLVPALQRARERATATVTEYQPPAGSYLADHIAGVGEGYWLAPGTSSICEEGACEHDDGADDHCDEGSFSWSGCEVCSSGLGGTLHAGHLLKGNGPNMEIIHVDICEDCLFFSANGDLPECRPERPCGGEGCEDCPDDDDTDE